MLCLRAATLIVQEIFVNRIKSDCDLAFEFKQQRMKSLREISKIPLLIYKYTI